MVDRKERHILSAGVMCNAHSELFELLDRGAPIHAHAFILHAVFTAG